MSTDNIPDFIPKKTNEARKTVHALKWKAVTIIDILNIARGDFHAIDDLDPGNFMTVSRVTEDNGVVGYFDRPAGAKVYERGKITVSTVGGDAFVQLDDFIATDNVIICSPKKPLRPSTMIFIAFALNYQKWRYSYGRQCYKAKFARTEIFVPVDDAGKLDEDTIAGVVQSASYWPQIKLALQN